MNSRINHLAVWILVVVYFLIGWGWYAIFGEKWLNLHARTMTDIEHTHNVSAYVLAFLGSIAVNYTLAVLIARTNPTRLVWPESRARMLVRLRVHGIRDYFC